MSGIIEEKDKVLSFTLFKVEKGREKICRLGTVEELREAREKQMPKKPTVNQYFYFCSNCGARRSIKQKHCFCHDCGQAIDWND